LFSEDALRRIASIDSVVALKEASFDGRIYLQTRRMIERLPRPIDLLTGNDNFIYESFVMGAEGALIGFGTLATDLQVRMLQLTLDGQWDQAREIWERRARSTGRRIRARGGIRGARTPSSASATSRWSPTRRCASSTTSSARSRRCPSARARAGPRGSRGISGDPG
jgi:hypothetical protein